MELTMSLPKLSVPLFDEVVPSTKQIVRYRPFLVKEEKLLLMANSGGTRKEMINAIKQIINNCVVYADGKEFDIEHLALFDLEYLFVKIRSKSVDNVVKLSYVDHEDEKTYSFDIKLDEVQIEWNEEHTNKIKVNDEVGIIMKYPTPAITEKVAADEQKTLNESDFSHLLIKECIDRIYDADQVYPIKEADPKEVDEFIDSLTVKAFEDIKKFFETLPRLYHKIEYTNSKGTAREIELTTLDDFFTLA
jgi:hypothetical protein